MRRKREEGREKRKEKRGKEGIWEGHAQGKEKRAGKGKVEQGAVKSVSLWPITCAKCNTVDILRGMKYYCVYITSSELSM